jgi:hypothetical protein
MALPILDGNQTATTLSTILAGGEHTPAHTVVSLGSQAITDMRGAVSGSVVSVSNFPASQTIAGTVTANGIARSVNDASDPQFLPLPVIGYDETIESANRGIVLPVQISTDLGSINNSNPLPISGTVTANTDSTSLFTALENYSQNWNDAFPVALKDVPNGVNLPTDLVDSTGISRFVNGNLPISGTVTANNPSGALTTRFGSVTTANTAQLTSAVTNTSRKYLLVQNIATSTVTIGIGFAPTTTQGIQLTAGAGLTFDAFTPTGAIYWLSSVTGSNFSILEG